MQHFNIIVTLLTSKDDHHDDTIDVLLTFKRPHLDASIITIVAIFSIKLLTNLNDDHQSDTIDMSMVCCSPSEGPIWMHQ